MQSLQSNGIYELHLATLFVSGGLFIFIFCLFLLMIFFGWSLHRVIKNATLMVSILVMAIAIPVTAVLLSSQTSTFTKAKEQIQIFNMSVNRIDDETLSVSYYTSSPVISYLEVKLPSGKIKPVFPDYELKAVTYHVFIVNTEGEKNGLLYIIINGKRYEAGEVPISFPD